MRNNVRKLLASLEEILWEHSDWKAISVSELFDESHVKKGYRRAMLVVHPGFFIAI